MILEKVGVIQITLDVASRENFYNKWTKAKAIVIGCIYTQAKTTFRNIPFIVSILNKITLIRILIIYYSKIVKTMKQMELVF